MNERIKIPVWIYISVLVSVALAGCLAVRQHLQPFQPVSAASPEGHVLTAVLSHQWHVRGIKRLPGIPGALVYRTVLIDPGHGGKDPGAQGVDGAVEKDIVLDIGLRLQKILAAHGVHASMTRARDEFLTLEERVGKIRSRHPDLFLSLHANSSVDSSVSGIEVFFAEDEAYWEDVHEALTDVILNSEESLQDVPGEIYQFDGARKHFRKESGIFAKHLSVELTKAVGTRNRGVKREHFYVLSEAPAPSILVELGFVTHPDEGRKLMTEKYRQTLAEALAKSLLDYVENE